MNAHIIKMLSKDSQVRILFLDSTPLISNLLGGNKMNAICQEALVTVFTLSSLLCGLLKSEQRLSILVNMSTPDRYISCDVDAHGNVRGYASESLVDYGHRAANVADLVGDKGFIKMTKDLSLGGLFTGVVDMPHKSIAMNFAHYFTQSEQTNTKFFHYYTHESGVVTLSQAVLLQPLPFCPPFALNELTERIEQRDSEIRALPIQARLHQAFADAVVVDKQQIQLYCGCTREMFYGMLNSLGEHELSEAAGQGRAIEMVCSICGVKHQFSPGELAQLITKEA